MLKDLIARSLLIAGIFASAATMAAASSQRNIYGPVGSVRFGAAVKVLPNGNIVVTDPDYNAPGALRAGAVYLYDGATGQIISKITGSTADDHIGNLGITVRDNGSYFFSSYTWDNGGAVDAGAITFGNQVTGVNGTVGADNSLIGTASNDKIGFGDTILLSNGNYIFSHTQWNGDRGAVTFVNSPAGVTGPITAANSLIGTDAGDKIAYQPGYISAIKQLDADHFYVRSPRWNQERGAFTICSTTTGCAGQVSSINSVVGDLAGDRICYGDDYIGDESDRGIKRLSNGNVILTSVFWHGVGAVTFIPVASGTSGVVSSSNSLTGGNFTFAIVELTNGNYVVISPYWNNSRGAVTWGSGTTGVSGEISETNSLVGSTGSDHVGVTVVSFVTNIGVTPLANGNYVVASPDWDLGNKADAGAATWGSGTTGVSGPIKVTNSYVGALANDRVAHDGVTALTNGNYVIRSSKWNNGRGAATFGNGTTGITGTIALANVLTGSAAGDGIANVGVAPLTNGDYIVQSPNWDNGLINVGAATYCSGTTGRTGLVSASNSLIGNHMNDAVGSGSVVNLPNGNYIIVSQAWNDGYGAATLIKPDAPVIGPVTPYNSLIGNYPHAGLGSYGIRILATGNYLVMCYNCRNGTAQGAGAITFVNSETGLTGEVSPANSLMSDAPGDYLGASGYGGIYLQPNGGYIVVSFNRTEERGSVTWGSGTTGVSGNISAANSLVGTPSSSSFNMWPLKNGDYVLGAPGYDNGSVADAGALTYISPNIPMTGVMSTKNSTLGTASQQQFGAWFGELNAPALFSDSSFIIHGKGADGHGTVTLTKGNSSLSGTVSYQNTVFGKANDIDTDLVSDYSPAANRMVVGRPGSNAVTVFKKESAFDFDGDNRSDLAVFRGSTNRWYYQRSFDGTSGEALLGLSTDKMVPADYTGDSKTDVAMYRPSTGLWYIIRSDDLTVTISGAFGAPNDIPAPADFDADGKADLAVFRPSNGTWYINNSATGLSIFAFGSPGDVPTPGDYDADGRADVAIFRPNAGTGNGEWWIQRSTAGIFVTVFGTSTDIPVVADYSGDGTTDVAIRRPSDGFWYVLQMEDFNYFAAPFGLGSDRPVPADYDGDGKADISIYRPSDGNWYEARTTGGITIQQLGVKGDKPAPAAYIP